VTCGHQTRGSGVRCSLAVSLLSKPAASSHLRCQPASRRFTCGAATGASCSVPAG